MLVAAQTQARGGVGHGLAVAEELQCQSLPCSQDRRGSLSPLLQERPRCMQVGEGAASKALAREPLDSRQAEQWRAWQAIVVRSVSQNFVDPPVGWRGTTASVGGAFGALVAGRRLTYWRSAANEPSRCTGGVTLRVPSQDPAGRQDSVRSLAGRGGESPPYRGGPRMGRGPRASAASLKPGGAAAAPPTGGNA